MRTEHQFLKDTIERAGDLWETKKSVIELLETRLEDLNRGYDKYDIENQQLSWGIHLQPLRCEEFLNPKSKDK